MIQNIKLPRVAITMGDPAGVGPEVVVKALADAEVAALAQMIVVGDRWLLDETAAALGLPAPELVLDLGRVDPTSFAPGKLSAVCGRAALEYIRAATRLCLEGKADAMVTAPVNKEAVSLSMAHFTGHTEFIADLCGVADAWMLLVNDFLRVIHVSTHVGLREACMLSPDRIVQTIRIGYNAVRAMGVVRPRIAVCGLNPHAGENGLFGSEDRDVIRHAVVAVQAEGILCDGPMPADTLFFQACRGTYDLVVAMYHDQGHIPMKLLDFKHTVNVSLGMPVIRTSVDHGTAFDIVGKNQADPDSMKAALRLAATMARIRTGDDDAG